MRVIQRVTQQDVDTSEVQTTLTQHLTPATVLTTGRHVAFAVPKEIRHRTHLQTLVTRLVILADTQEQQLTTGPPLTLRMKRDTGTYVLSVLLRTP